MTQFAAVIELSDLDGSNGFTIDGVSFGDISGWSVSNAGDVNGDGFADVIVGAPSEYSINAGAAYVVFGQAGGFAANIALSGLDGINGFKLTGIAVGDLTGGSVSTAGDINGDGFADVVVGAREVNGGTGAAFVVFGHTGGFLPNIDLSGLDGSNGFRIDGVAANNQAGYSVSSAGDVNGDGYADVLVGALNAAGGSGASYVLFGHATGFASDIALSSLDGVNGFAITDAAAGSLSGHSVATAGDINGDGFADLIIGAPLADPDGNGNSGTSYVLFGGPTVGASGNIDLATLDGVNGFAISGVAAGDFSGYSVSGGGDVNGDGFADLVIGADEAAPNGNLSGATYVVFGGPSVGASEVINLATLDGTNGFRISGIAGYGAGFRVSSAGDVNGDGFDDLLIGLLSASPGGRHDAGGAYVVFGTAAGFPANIDLSSIDGENGFKINGATANSIAGEAVSAAGDVNGDGFADLIVGAYRGDAYAGASYVIFGHGPDEAVSRSGSDIANTIQGGAFDDVLKGLGGDDVLYGQDGDDRLNGGGGDDTLIAGDGNDTLIGGKGTNQLDGGNGDDSIEVGKWLRSDSVIDGGAGFDTLKLNGDYSFGLRFAPATITGIEEIKVRDGFSYDLRFDDANVAAGQTLIVSGASLTGANFLAVDGSHEMDGAFKLYGGAGDDHLTGGANGDVLQGGAGDDVLQGSGGADILIGGAGVDTFVYRQASDSAGSAIDWIRDFDASADKIDLWFNLNGIDATQNAASIGQLGTVFDASHLHIHDAAIADIGSHVYLVIDANGVAGYQAGADLLIRVDGMTGTLTTGDFI